MRVILTSFQPLARLCAKLHPAFWARLAPMASEMPHIRSRADWGDVLAERGAKIARAFGCPWQGGEKSLPAQENFADLDALEAALSALHLAELEGRAVDFADLSPKSGGDLHDFAQEMREGRFSLAEHEARLRAMALDLAGGNLSAAARLLGLSRAQLAYRQGVK